MTVSSSLSALLVLALHANVEAKSVRGAGTSAPSICNRAWSNSGHAKRTDCSGADVIFSSSSDNSDAVQAGLNDPNVISMVYLSVGTVNQNNPADPRLADYAWEENDDSNGDGGVWGDDWYNPDDLVPNVLPIMKELMDEYKAMGFNMVSTDNAKPSDAVTDNDAAAARHRNNKRVDPRYVEYMDGFVDYAHSIGLQVALKNPSYYTNEAVIDKFDAFLVESLFNWYPSDINNYNNDPNLLTGPRPMWVFQYEGINGVSNSELRDRMSEQGVDMVYMDTNNGWEEFYADVEPVDTETETSTTESESETTSTTSSESESETETETTSTTDDKSETTSSTETENETTSSTTSSTETESETTSSTSSSAESETTSSTTSSTESETTSSTTSSTETESETESSTSTTSTESTTTEETETTTSSTSEATETAMPLVTNSEGYNPYAYNSVIELMEQFYGVSTTAA